MSGVGVLILFAGRFQAFQKALTDLAAVPFDLVFHHHIDGVDVGFIKFHVLIGDFYAAVSGGLEQRLGELGDQGIAKRFTLAAQFVGDVV